MLGPVSMSGVVEVVMFETCHTGSIEGYTRFHLQDYELCLFVQFDNSRSRFLGLRGVKMNSVLFIVFCH